MAHRGFSYLHILSPCVSFDKTDLTYKNMDLLVRDLPEDHDPGDHTAAMQLAAKAGHGTPSLGLFYSAERPTLSDGMDDIVARATA